MSTFPETARRLGRHLIAAALLLGVGGCEHHQPAVAATASVESGRTVAVGPVLVEPAPFPGVQARRDEDEFVRRLMEAATRQAERSVRKVEGVAPGLKVTGKVVLPVTLPPSVRGMAAYFRRGHLATAEMRLEREDGTVTREKQAKLDWDDVRWTTGSHKTRRARSLDDVITDAVKKVVDRAVKRLGDE